MLTELLVVNDGAVESLLLEWTGARRGFTGWQYRYREYYYRDFGGLWSAWQAVPDSDAATRSYRVSVPAGTYEFEVRGVGPGTVGLPSVPGLPASLDPLDKPRSIGTSLEAGRPRGVGARFRMVKGDGVTAWWVGDRHFTIVIPDGVRLFGLGAYEGAQCPLDNMDCIMAGVVLVHHATGSSLLFSLYGDDWEPFVSETLDPGVAANVHTLFDQLIASVRRLGVETPDLIVISDGAPDALILEWSGAPEGTTNWQYRLRTYLEGRLLMTGLWTDIPDSTASTRNYRLTGLAADTYYEVEVRAVIGAEDEVVSSPRWQCCSRDRFNITAPSGGPPTIGYDQVIEGDGITKWRVSDLDLLVTIPDGMRVALVGGDTDSDGTRLPVGLREMESDSTIWFDPLDGSEIGRSGGCCGRPFDPPPEPGIGALFDQIAGSVELR